MMIIVFVAGSLGLGIFWEYENDKIRQGDGFAVEILTETEVVFPAP